MIVVPWGLMAGGWGGGYKKPVVCCFPQTHPTYYNHHPGLSLSHCLPRFVLSLGLILANLINRCCLQWENECGKHKQIKADSYRSFSSTLAFQNMAF